MKEEKEKDLLVIKQEDDFLDTACRIKMNTPQGVIPYLDLEENSDIIENNWNEGPIFPNTSTEYKSLSLKTKTKFIETSTFKVRTKINKELENDLSYYHGLEKSDTDSLTNSTLIHEALNGSQRRLYDLYKNLGNTSSEEVNYSTRWKRFLYLTIGIKPITYTDDVARSIIVFSNIIAVRSRRGRGNFVIVNPRIGSLLQDSKYFSFIGANRITLVDRVITKIGSISGISVYVNNYLKWDENEIVIGRRSEANSSGVYYLEYMRDIESSDVIVDPSNFIPNTIRELKEKSATVCVGDSGNKLYLTARVETSKKPLWRRIIGA